MAFCFLGGLAERKGGKKGRKETHFSPLFFFGITHTPHGAPPEFCKLCLSLGGACRKEGGKES